MTRPAHLGPQSGALSQAVVCVTGASCDVVVGFDEFGIPLVDFVELLADRGNRNSQEEIGDAICAALA